LARELFFYILTRERNSFIISRYKRIIYRIFFAKKRRKFMDKKMMLMRRTSLRTLGCVLMDISLPVEEALGEERSEEETLGMIRDDLGLALRNGGDNLKVRLERVVEEAWKQGKQAGFLAGMQAGARIILSLTGEGADGP
jgi:hypothetical protein